MFLSSLEGLRMATAGFYAAPVRGLRASLYSGQAAQVSSVARVSTMAFTLALLAVVVEFCVSGNLLAVMGISYSQPGGNPLVKFHPATYLAFMGAAVALVSGSAQNRGLGYLLGKAPALLLFIAVMVFCTIFATANVGLTGAGVYIDTYLSAGALAIIMVNASDRQRAILGRLVLALVVVNVLISLAEYVHQDHFITLETKTGDGKTVTDVAGDEFRPAALYAHPLTGAMATAFGLFLVMSSGLSFTTTAACFGLFSIGLLGFGGRAALGVAVGVVVLRVLVTLARDFARGKVNARLLGTIALCIAIMGPVTLFLLTATPVGERIAARTYYDDSAEVRADQWLVVGKLTPSQAMFGTPAVNLEQIYEQVGLLGVENPLILIFLNLGIIGSPIFACGLVAYFLYLRRAYPESGWLLLAAIFILFSSNSIGVKSPDLFMLTACAVTMRNGLGLGAPAQALRLFRPRVFLSNRQGTGLVQDVKARGQVMSVTRRNQGLAAKVVQRD